MAFDLNKLSQMAKSRPEEAKQKATDRKKNREWLRISQDIALALHYYLRSMRITQKELADKMQVSPTYVGKLLKGQENLTLETICNIQKVIGKNLISVSQPYEHEDVMKHHSFIFLPSTKQSVVFHSRQNISTGYAPITGGVA